MQAKCCICGDIFEVPVKRYNESLKRGWRFYCSDTCREKKFQVKKHCLCCGKGFWVSKNSKQVYCSNECKNTHKSILDLHKLTIDSMALKTIIALKYCEHFCHVCGWQEDERLLQVYHLDKDFENQAKENLILLCPTCYIKAMSDFYLLKKQDTRIFLTKEKL